MACLAAARGTPPEGTRGSALGQGGTGVGTAPAPGNLHVGPLSLPAPPCPGRDPPRSSPNLEHISSIIKQWSSIFYRTSCKRFVMGFERAIS